ncbi:MAG TPA: hypothetical protein VFA70_14980 [Dehalococcoidia bacterium]|jgi:hypothetical protein|nr:hypothetical protein [Dehalococcoidia bacterium]
MSTESFAATVIIPSCTERDFFETVFPYGRFGAWTCIYCGEPLEYTSERIVYVGKARLACGVEDLGGFHQLRPLEGAAVAVNRCCSDRIARADDAIEIGRTITCPICGDTYTCAMVERWQGTSRVKGYLRGGAGYAVDHDLAVPALLPVERVSGRR